MPSDPGGPFPSGPTRLVKLAVVLALVLWAITHTRGNRGVVPSRRAVRGCVVLLSGEPRSFRTTLPRLVREVMTPLQADVYAFCSGDDSAECDAYERTLRAELGPRLRAYDSLVAMRAREVDGVPLPTDSMSLAYLAAHEARREAAQRSVGAYQGLQFVVVRLAWDLALRAEAAAGTQYDTVVRLRPDVLMLDPLPLGAMRLQPGGWVYAINDWFAIGRRDAMLSIVTLADTYATHKLPPGFAPAVIGEGFLVFGAPVCGETQLMLRLLRDGVRYYPVPAMTAGLVRVGDFSADLAAIPYWHTAAAERFLADGTRPPGRQFEFNYLIHGWLGPDATHAFLFEDAPNPDPGPDVPPSG